MEENKNDILLAKTLDGVVLDIFQEKETVRDILYILDGLDANNIILVPDRSSNVVIEEDLSNPTTTEEQSTVIVEQPIEEAIVTDKEDEEYTIMSASDFSDEKDQIPLVKVKLNHATGQYEAYAIDDSKFAKADQKTAQASLKSSIGKPLKDRLLRIDKSLNHNDPNLSTEASRNLIRANRGEAKKSVKDLYPGEDYTTEENPDNPLDQVDTERKINTKFNAEGTQTLASQLLIHMRDELKTLANVKSSTEEKLVDLFKQLTGVDYYTEKIVNELQYNYLLELLGHSSDKYNKSHLTPDDNKYVQYMKDLTEDLIEKVNLRNDPENYKK